LCIPVAGKSSRSISLSCGRNGNERIRIQCRIRESRYPEHVTYPTDASISEHPRRSDLSKSKLLVEAYRL
jgi:hypothetical protein